MASYYVARSACLLLSDATTSGRPACFGNTLYPERQCSRSRLGAANCSSSDNCGTNHNAAASKPAYTYNSSDGKQKATIEQIFRVSQQTDFKTPGAPPAPWGFGWQMNERNLVWNDDLKFRLLKRAVSDKLNQDEEVVEARLIEIQTLLPDLGTKLPSMKVDLLARLATDTSQLAQRLVALKEVLPRADVGQMVARRPSLVLDDSIDGVKAAVERLRELLPDCEIDGYGYIEACVGTRKGCFATSWKHRTASFKRPGASKSAAYSSKFEEDFVSGHQALDTMKQDMNNPCADTSRMVAQHPAVLNVEAFEKALEEAARVLPKGTNIPQLLTSQPNLIFSFQRGSELIPYDPHKTEP